MKKIKALMQNRVDLFEKKGGDLILMQQWKRLLEGFGTEVTLSNNINENLEPYDIIHLFNTTRIHETFIQYINAKRQGKKIVITPLYHSIKEIERFDAKGQYDLMHFFNSLIPNIYYREQIKNIMRSIKDKRQRRSVVEVLRYGFRKAQATVLQGVDFWIPNAEQEVITINNEIQVTNKFIIARNGIDLSQINKHKVDVGKNYGLKDYILCIGRIEPRKNQLSLFKSIDKKGPQLVIIGNMNKNYTTKLNNSFCNNFLEEIKNRPNIRWIKEVPYEELGSFYSNAHVHINPSWFEVVSMVNLEAAACGCNIVLSDVGYQREYFGDEAFYCDPGNINSISDNIAMAFNKPKLPNSGEKYIKNYSWKLSAENVQRAYESVL